MVGRIQGRAPVRCMARLRVSVASHGKKYEYCGVPAEDTCTGRAGGGTPSVGIALRPGTGSRYFPAAATCSSWLVPGDERNGT